MFANITDGMPEPSTPKIKIEAEISEAALQALRAVAQKEGITLEEAAGRVIAAGVNERPHEAN